MLSRNFKSSSAAKQTGKSVKRTGATTDVRCNSRTGNPQFWEWTKSKDEARSKQNIDPVCKPQNTHRDSCIACSAKDRVHHKQHDDSDIPGQHYSREFGSLFHNPGRAAHQSKQLWRKRRANDRYYCSHDQRERNRLYRSSRGTVGIALADPAS